MRVAPDEIALHVRAEQGLPGLQVSVVMDPGKGGATFSDGNELVMSAPAVDWQGLMPTLHEYTTASESLIQTLAF